MTIAVLLTTFNRKQKTLACLQSLKNQKLPEDVSLKIFLTDDASADGTADAVKSVFPDVHIYHGNGSLFWAGGMRNTWQQALSADVNYYLLLNDDTLLKETAIYNLLKCSNYVKSKGSKPAICIGSTADDETGKISYGGRKLNSAKSWDGGYFVYSETEYVNCDVANANILLVPAEIVKHLGILSEKFTHGLADYDYTLKAKKAGFGLVVAPGFLGTCIDDHGNNWKSANTTLKERIAYLKSPKGLAYHEFLGFIKEHFPRYYPVAFFKLWLKTLFPFIWDTFKNK
ncbi:glycosyltransferase family 2 protein [Mucilaginibacter arboris]|uniref:Glycosyltransferase n=1 Tax=Mucilaginibacter arboris TaxID=2682090 RepID=A0A7K1T1L8_9SPHI|nr:glycosyltransferase family 2 protein [Mucilaginibacter arboris]MVN23449.1 glycosyltransferase [Mucilaginibacter arboris]